MATDNGDTSKPKDASKMKFTLNTSILKWIVIGWSLFVLMMLIVFFAAPCYMPSMGQLGDSFAIINSVATLITIYGLLYQNQQLSDQNKQAQDAYVKQQIATRREQFENAFSQLVSNFQHQSENFEFTDAVGVRFLGLPAFTALRLRMDQLIAGEALNKENWDGVTVTMKQYLLALDVLLRRIDLYTKKKDKRQRYYDIIASVLSQDQIMILYFGSQKYEHINPDYRGRISRFLSSTVM